MERWKRDAIFDFCPAPGGMIFDFETLKRPVIQEKQHEGQGDEHRLAHQTQEKEDGREQIEDGRSYPLASPCSYLLSPISYLLRIACVGEQRQHEEKGAEHVLAFGHPGNRFDVNRVEREEGRHHGAGPGSAGHSLQQEKEQHCIGRVEQKVREVMEAWIQAEHLDIQGVRKPGQGMPIRGVAAAEGPDHSFPGQPLVNVRVLGDVKRVIEVDELATRHGPKDGERRGGKEGTDENGAAGVFLAGSHQKGILNTEGNEGNEEEVAGGLGGHVKGTDEPSAAKPQPKLNELNGLNRLNEEMEICASRANSEG